MNTDSVKSTLMGGHIYISGYIEGRVNNGDTRKYHYPDSSLPDLPNTEFPDLEPSFVTALSLKK